MDPIGKQASYFAELSERAKKSRAYTPHQLAGLELAEMLHDRKHKSLYMKLAKEYRVPVLFTLAKTTLEKSNIKNPGAYFMSLIKNLPKAHKG